MSDKQRSVVLWSKYRLWGYRLTFFPRPGMKRQYDAARRLAKILKGKQP